MEGKGWAAPAFVSPERGTSMDGRTRRAVIASLLVSSAACGGAFALAPTSRRGGPGRQLYGHAFGGRDLGHHLRRGVHGPRNLNDGETTQRLNVDANGNFLLKRFQKNTDYTVLAVGEDQADVFVNCRVVKAPNPQDPQQKPTPPPGTGNDREQGRLAAWRSRPRRGRLELQHPAEGRPQRRAQ